MKQAAIVAFFSLIVMYIGDYAVARAKPLGSVQVQPYYAIHLKSGRTEFDYNVAPETQSCVASLLPHLGSNPCWYMNGHKTRKIEI